MVRHRRATSTALLRSGRPLLLTLHPETAALHRDAEPWSDRIITVAATPAPATDAATAPGAGTSTGIGAGAVLVRPDGHVVWAQGGDTPLRAALTHWFGPPAAHRTAAADHRLVPSSSALEG
ncbi:aromatic-ring hydroxylase C-terminal domain-containing protein [Streptomyces sp. NBC_01356]